MKTSKKVKIAVAIAITAIHVVMLVIPSMVWVYSGQLPFWWSWEGQRITAAWLVGVCSSLMAWSIVDTH